MTNNKTKRILKMFALFLTKNISFLSFKYYSSVFCSHLQDVNAFFW